MPETRFCPFCGQPRDSGKRFCPNCGNEYPVAEQAAAEDEELTQLAPSREPTPRGSSPAYRTLPFLAAVLLGAVLAGYALFRFGVAYLESRRPEPGAAPVLIASPPPAPSPAVGASPSPVVIQPSGAQPALARARVDTDGQGANLRQAPSTSGTVVAQIEDGTVLDIIGPDQQGDGRTWRNVREPGGATGWVAADLLSSE